MGYMTNVFLTCFRHMFWTNGTTSVLSLWHFCCAFPQESEHMTKSSEITGFCPVRAGIRGGGGSDIGGQVNRIPSEVLSGRRGSATVARCRERLRPLSLSLLSSNVY